jgi:two-component system, NtrC family, nitrogen regulation sensor histidine kinase GlnL
MMPATDAQRQLASLSLAVLLLGPDQTIAAANPAAEQFLGQSIRRLVGRRLSEVLRFDEPRLTEGVADSDAQISARATGVFLLGQGARQIDATIAPMIDQPGWQVLTIHDISSVGTMDENVSSDGDAVLRAPEILAHEIKNPLAGIRGAAQLLGRKSQGAELALTGLITDEVDRIAKLIDQMQSLSRRTPQILTPCNLHEAIRRARAVLDAGKLDVQGQVPAVLEEFDPSLPPVLGNVDALVQVLINLVANASEACRNGPQPQVVIRTRFASGLQFHPSAQGKPVRLPIELRVSDNGPGIDPAMRDHVFEPFVTTKKSGQGLGLALVRRLVRDMNGRVNHDRDETGKWTHFRVHLPMASEVRRIDREQAA